MRSIFSGSHGHGAGRTAEVRTAKRKAIDLHAHHRLSVREQRHARLSPRSAHPRPAIETGVCVQSRDNAKDLRGLVGGKIREELIIANWPDLFRCAATMATGKIKPSQLLRKLASYPRQNDLAAAFREVGRVGALSL